MEKLDLTSYFSEVASSENINKCRKPPLPDISDRSYIFISYAHDHYKEVYKTLAYLYVNGVRFWYDSGLTAGRDWDDEVKQKIRHPNCIGAIFFLSKKLFLSRSVVNTELPCILGAGEDGEELTEVTPLNYFSVNLTNNKPSEIIRDALNESDLDTEWLGMLIKAFPNKATYVSVSEFEYLDSLLTRISKSFNVVDDIEESNPIYYGQYKDGKYHGKGKLIYPENSDCDLYYGDFEDGEFSGNGYLFLKNGAVYEGSWENDSPNGYGIWRNGIIYEGEFLDGEYDGYGIMSFPNNSRFEGEWKNGERNGYGVFYFNGGTFESEWKDGNNDGYGILRFKTGHTCEGHFIDNKLYGYGIYRHSNGDVYEGESKDFKRNGFGIMRFADGNVYEGDWKNDKFNGYGIYRCADGRRYEGHWKNEFADGYGVFYWPDGAIHQGEWKNGKPNGYGIMRYPDGTAKAGIWKDGTLVEDESEIDNILNDSTTE